MNVNHLWSANGQRLTISDEGASPLAALNWEVDTGRGERSGNLQPGAGAIADYFFWHWNVFTVFLVFWFLVCFLE